MSSGLVTARPVAQRFVPRAWMQPAAPLGCVSRPAGGAAPAPCSAATTEIGTSEATSARISVATDRSVLGAIRKARPLAATLTGGVVYFQVTVVCTDPAAAVPPAIVNSIR
jgi:hypothetical protein